jgi:hypothetical protein
MPLEHRWTYVERFLSDIDAPIDFAAVAGTSAGGGGTKAGAAISDEQVTMLADMGFTPDHARKALRETVSVITWGPFLIRSVY